VTAPTITPVSLGEAHAALHMAMERADQALFAAEIIALADALETYKAIDGYALHWEAVWPELRETADPDEAALIKAAEDAAAAAADLIAALAAMGGTEDTEQLAVGVTA
jgi:hypothetical protein